MKTINCSGKDLSTASGISSSVISRYRSGNRVPIAESSYLYDLAAGLHSLAVQKKIKELEKEDFYSVLSNTLCEDGSYERCRKNLKYLMLNMKISNIDLARSLNFAPSHVSRILSGQRKPGDFQLFVKSTSRYIARRFIGTIHMDQLTEMIDCSKKGSRNEDVLSTRIEIWLLSNETE